MMFSWAVAAVPFGIYTIAQYLNIPLQLQPQLFLLLALITWGQCMHYDKNWSLKKCILVIVSLCIVFGGIEVGVIFGIRVCAHFSWS
jgi:4-amino-4-deoxy-L-arabinose transferase-like glycosyltransferase